MNSKKLENLIWIIKREWPKSSRLHSETLKDFSSLIGDALLILEKEGKLK